MKDNRYELHRTTKLVSDCIRDFSEVNGVSLVGSATRSYVKLPTDLDFLVTVDEQLPYDVWIKRLSRAGTKCELARCRWRVSDNTLRTWLGGVLISLAFMKIDEFEDELISTINGYGSNPDYKSWTVGGHVREVLLADIVDSLTIFDKSGFMTKWIGELELYPPRLRKAILSSSSKELRIRTKILMQAAGSDDSLFFNCSIYALMLPLVRGLFAYNKIYFRGMKHLTKQIERYIPWEIEAISRLETASPKNTESVSAYLSTKSSLFSDEGRILDI